MKSSHTPCSLMLHQRVQARICMLFVSSPFTLCCTLFCPIVSMICPPLVPTVLLTTKSHYPYTTCVSHACACGCCLMRNLCASGCCCAVRHGIMQDAILRQLCQTCSTRHHAYIPILGYAVTKQPHATLVYVASHTHYHSVWDVTPRSGHVCHSPSVATPCRMSPWEMT